MRRSARVVLGDKSWTIKRVPKVKDKGKLCFGLCCPTTHIIWLEESLSGPKLLRFALHEMLHAQCDWLDEDYVDKYTFEMANALESLGFFEDKNNE